MLHGKFVNVTDFLANPVGVLAYLRINQFGIYLRGEDGLMPQHFLKGFQRHSLEYGQNGKRVASDVRGDLDPAVAFPAYDSKTEPHGIVFTYRKDTFGESFFSSVPLYFSISSIAMGNNFTTYATPVFIRLPISHVPPSESVWILSYVMAFKST